MNINNIYTRFAVSNKNIIPFKQKEASVRQINGPTQDVFVRSNNNSSKPIAFGAKVLVDDKDIQEIQAILGIKGKPGETSAEIADIKRELKAQAAITQNTMNFLHINGKNLETSEAKSAAINGRVRLDPKTSLNNMDALLEDIQYVKDEYLAKGKPVTFAIFDLDNFKSVNDLLSYDVGDVLIKLAANNINSAVSKQGFKAYRFGGEEFIVIMPDVEQKQALPLAQSIIDSVNGASFTEEYIKSYISSGKKIIDTLSKVQAPYKEVMDEIENQKHLEKLVKDPSYSSLIGDSPRTSSIVKYISRNKKAQLEENALNLLLRAKASASNQNEKDIIEAGISRIADGEKISSVFEDGTQLSSLLYSMYYKQDKINEIRKWIEYVQLPDENGDQRGFTMSGGVIQFDDAKCDSNEYIHDTGEVLAFAKRNQKGRLFQKNGNDFTLYKPRRGKC